MGAILDQLAEELGIDPNTLRDGILARDEALSTNYLTLDASGRVGANFTGHIHGQGFDLDEAAAFDPINALSWKDSAAVVREAIAGLVDAGKHSLEVFITGAPGAQITVLDEQGKSGFLKIALANRTATFGSKAITWPGGSSDSNIVTTAHNLGVAPVVVVAVCKGVNAVNAKVTTGNYTVTNFDVQLHTDPGNLPANGFSANADWIAIG